VHCAREPVEGRSIEEIFGDIDSVKFRSSMTLFAEAGAGTGIFAKALEKYFDGQADQLTLDRLGPESSGFVPQKCGNFS
jgi:uncharacterized protein (DUF1810 family)